MELIIFSAYLLYIGVSVPGKENVGWTVDKLADLPAKPLKSFDIASLKGRWYKVMGLDSRYDCFDCQKNSFEVKDKATLKMEALFRIPRPTAPGFLQSKIVEELHAAVPESMTPFQNNTILLIIKRGGMLYGFLVFIPT